MAERTIDVSELIPIPFGDLVAFEEFCRATGTKQGLALAGLCQTRVELWVIRNPVPVEPEAPAAPAVSAPVAGNRHVRRAARKRS